MSQVPTSKFQALFILAHAIGSVQIVLYGYGAKLNAGNRYYCMFKVLEAGHQTNA